MKTLQVGDLATAIHPLNQDNQQFHLATLKAKVLVYFIQKP